MHRSDWPFNDEADRLRLKVTVTSNIEVLNQQFVFDNQSPPNMLNLTIMTGNDIHIVRFLQIALVGRCRYTRDELDGVVRPINNTVSPQSLNPLTSFWYFDFPKFSQYFEYGQ